MLELFGIDAALAGFDFREALRPHAERLASIAKELAPVDTGFLRDNIEVEDDGAFLAVVSYAAYSVYQEFGTYKMAAHPFMRPALAEVQGRA